MEPQLTRVKVDTKLSDVDNPVAANFIATKHAAPFRIETVRRIAVYSQFAETRDAISDHNDIRDAVAKVGDHEVDTDSWFDAIAATNKANSKRMGEEDQESLTDFGWHTSLQQRHELGVAFVTFEARNYQGVKSKDKDPDAYIEQHTR